MTPPSDSHQFPDARSQRHLPLAIVHGTAVTELPQDLYIPPDALEVFLEAFEGPLDLLLYLIKRQNLDILDIPIATVTRQYMEYIELMKDLRLELAGEYLLMAAMLAEIKSRLLLPRPESAEEEGDPRAELVRRLQEYERFKQAAQDLNEHPQVGRDTFLARAEGPKRNVVKLPPPLTMEELLNAVRDVMVRAAQYTHHHIQFEPLSVRERMSIVLSQVDREKFVSFVSLFTPKEGRRGVVVTLLAVLELLKEALIELVQTEPFQPIYVKAIGVEPAVVPVEDDHGSTSA